MTLADQSVLLPGDSLVERVVLKAQVSLDFLKLLLLTRYPFDLTRVLTFIFPRLVNILCLGSSNYFLLTSQADKNHFSLFDIRPTLNKLSF